jgi:hypothetical protein
VNVIGVPLQAFALGVTVIVPEIGVLPALVATKEGIFPVAPIPKPIAVFELAQVYVVFATPKALEKLIAEDVIPSHIGNELTALTVGIGLTVIVKVCGVPKQSTPFKVNFGVTVMVLTIGFGVVLVTVNDGIFPTPEAASPIEVLELVQLNTVFGTLPVKLILPVVVPEQRTIEEIGLTVGIGFTVIVIMSVA